jgi:hypothetical protein
MRVPARRGSLVGVWLYGFEFSVSVNGFEFIVRWSRVKVQEKHIWDYLMVSSAASSVPG